MPLDSYYFRFATSLKRPSTVSTTIFQHKVIFCTQYAAFLNADFAYKLQTLYLPYLAQQCDLSYRTLYNCLNYYYNK